MSVMIIGIAGGTGSGKTTLTENLKQEFGDAVTVVYHDNYYKCNDHLPMEERVKLNYDHPDAFDTDLMIEHLKKLKNGETVECPTYDYSHHTRSKETITIEPSSVIIVEGILIFQNEQLRNLMDIKIFVDADADERILRRIVRDKQTRNRSLESVIEQYLTTVKPMHEQFVEPSKRLADITVSGGRNLVALDLIKKRIKHHVIRTCAQLSKADRIALAEDLFTQGFACSQAVFAAFSDMFGIDMDTALKISSGLGGGVGRMREVCGVVTAASMVLGMKYGTSDSADKKAKAETYSKVREFADKFKEKEDTVICRELLGLLKAEKSYVPAERTKEYYAERPCLRLVKVGVEILCDMLEI